MSSSPSIYDMGDFMNPVGLRCLYGLLVASGCPISPAIITLRYHIPLWREPVRCTKLTRQAASPHQAAYPGHTLDDAIVSHAFATSGLFAEQLLGGVSAQNYFSCRKTWHPLCRVEGMSA